MGRLTIGRPVVAKGNRTKYIEAGVFDKIVMSRHEPALQEGEWGHWTQIEKKGRLLAVVLPVLKG